SSPRFGSGAAGFERAGGTPSVYRARRSTGSNSGSSARTPICDARSGAAGGRDGVGESAAAVSGGGNVGDGAAVFDPLHAPRMTTHNRTAAPRRRRPGIAEPESRLARARVSFFVDLPSVLGSDLRVHLRR